MRSCKNWQNVCVFHFLEMPLCVKHYQPEVCIESPKGLAQYLGKDVVKIKYNCIFYQHYNQRNYGQLYLRFLQTIDIKFKDSLSIIVYISR